MSRSGFKKVISIVLVLFAIGISPNVYAQEVFEYTPDDATFLAPDIRATEGEMTYQLAPGHYDMDAQIRFQNGFPTLQGSGSGLGSNATILDFWTYSMMTEDSRALSVRGPVIVKDLTIMHVAGRVADLRTGWLDTPSDDTVIFENVWFINCGTVLKSTGGRTVGTAENPMIVRNCVFATTADFPQDFAGVGAAMTFRDTTYAVFDHCDFFNHRELVHMRLDEPETAPNEGPVVTIKNSIFLATNGDDGTPETDDFYVGAGSLTVEDSVLWDMGHGGALMTTGDGTAELIDTVTADPLYVNVSPDILAEELDFNVQPGSPAEGLASDGLNAGSVAAEPASITDWSLR